MWSKRILRLALLGPFLAIACTSQTSADRNAQRAAMDIAQIHFDPNSRPLTADNIRVLKPLMQHFYDIGKQDRAEKLPLTKAMEKARIVDCPGVIQGDDKTIFAGKMYEAEDAAAQQKIVASSAKSAYLDGYNGVP